MALRRILHISDLHLCENKDSLSLLQKNKFLDDWITSLKNIEVLDTLIISGDIVDKGGSQKIYKKAYEVIKRLQEELGIEHILCVPGNHDVSRNLLNGIRGNEDVDSNQLWKYYDEKLKYYWEFVKKNNLGYYKNSGLVSYKILHKPNMIFLGLDSTDRIGTSDNLGFVNVENLKQALRQLKEENGEKYDGYTKIAVMHHRPVVYESGSQTYTDNNNNDVGQYGTCDSENWEKVKKVLLEYDVHYVLTGHVHGSQSVQIRSFDLSNDEINYSTVGSIGVDFSRELKVLLNSEKDKELLAKLEELQCYVSLSGNHNAYNIWTFDDSGLVREEQYKYVVDEGDRRWCRWQSKDFEKGKEEQIEEGGIFDKEVIISPFNQEEQENYEEKILEWVRDYGLYKTGHYHWKNTARINWIDTSYFFQHREKMLYIASGINELFKKKDELSKVNCIIGLGIKGAILLSYVRFLFPDKRCSYLPENKKEYNRYELELFKKGEKINSIAVLTDVVHSGNTVKSFVIDVYEKIGRFLKVNVVTIFDATTNRRIADIPEKAQITLFSLAELKVIDCQGGGDNCDVYMRKLANVIEYKED